MLRLLQWGMTGQLLLGTLGLWGLAALLAALRPLLLSGGAALRCRLPSLPPPEPVLAHCWHGSWRRRVAACRGTGVLCLQPPLWWQGNTQRGACCVHNLLQPPLCPCSAAQAMSAHGSRPSCSAGCCLRHAGLPTLSPLDSSSGCHAAGLYSGMPLPPLLPVVLCHTHCI